MTHLFVLVIKFCLARTSVTRTKIIVGATLTNNNFGVCNVRRQRSLYFTQVIQNISKSRTGVKKKISSSSNLCQSINITCYWNVNDSAITVIMIRRGLRSSSSLLHPLPSVWSLNKHFETRAMAPFRPVAARIRSLQDLTNQLHYNRREC